MFKQLKWHICQGYRVITTYVQTRALSPFLKWGQMFARGHSLGISTVSRDYWNKYANTKFQNPRCSSSWEIFDEKKDNTHTHRQTLLWQRLTIYPRARENRKNSRSGPKLRILDRFQTPQNANKSVQQVCALNPIFPQPTNFHESMMSKNHKRSSLPKLTMSAHLLNAILW